MNTASEIQVAIMRANLTNDDINAIVECIRYKRAQLTKANKRSLAVGATVKFTNSKTGSDIQGIIEKIMTKNVLINTGSGRWKVPANMLSVL